MNIRSMQKCSLQFSQKPWSCQKSAEWCVLLHPVDFCWQIKRNILMQVTRRRSTHTLFIYIYYRHCTDTKLVENGRPTLIYCIYKIVIEQLYTVKELYIVIHPKIKICWKLAHPQAIQNVNKFVSSAEQIWKYVVLHDSLTNGSSVANVCRQKNYNN